jgi:hypothetical protein
MLPWCSWIEPVFGTLWISRWSCGFLTAIARDRIADAVHAYLHRPRQEAKAVREMIQASQLPRPNLRAALMARAKASEQSDAPKDFGTFFPL